MEHADSQLKHARDPFPEILHQALQKGSKLSNPANLFEFQAILDDQLAAQRVLKKQQRPRRFVYGPSGFRAAERWTSKKPVTFRSDSIGIVYSDIVPIGRECVLLELSKDVNRSLLKLAPGRKNQEAVNISLYKGEGLIEKLQLRKRIHWDLDRLAPGKYRLVLGKHKTFQFVIQE